MTKVLTLTLGMALINFSANAESFADSIKSGYEVRGSIFFPSENKGLIIIQKSTSVLTCAFDIVTYEHGRGINPSSCRDISQ